MTIYINLYVISCLLFNAVLTNRTSKRVKRQQSCNTKMDKQIKHRHSPLPKIPRLTKGKVEYGNIEKKSLLILKHLVSQLFFIIANHLTFDDFFKEPFILIVV